MNRKTSKIRNKIFLKFKKARARVKNIFISMKSELNDNKEQVNSFQALLTLTPRVLYGNEKERIDPYLSRLKQAIDQEGIRNIALTGNYGSGKSTILKTFEHYNSEYNYLSISLASFNNIKKDDEENDNKESEDYQIVNYGDESFEEKLEFSILQQFFYKVSADKIPDSRFKRIKDFDNQKTKWLLLFSALWITSVFFLFGFDFVNDLNPRAWDQSQSISWIALTSGVIFIIGILFLAKYGLRNFSNSKINKFSIKGEVEFGEASVFNHYLDEIIYFFEKTEYDVVIFEDIDRFNTTDIFTKLRELNSLINNCDIIDREISFIYAIKDTLFKDKIERVKFFDFIIPVIPFVNSKNASEQLNKLIQEYHLSDKLSNEFVSRLASYIHDIDMRLLINTFHEFNVFKEKIGDEDINFESLFSIIVYKNLHPEDFSKLYRKKGKLYNVINKRGEYVDSLTEELLNKIQEKEEKLPEFDRHKHIQVQELKSIYLLKLLEELPNDCGNIILNNKRKSISELIEDVNFNEIKQSSDIRYSRFNNNQKLNSGISFNEIEKLVHDSMSYEERKKYIVESNRNKSNSIKNEILEIKREIKNIKKLSLAEIFDRMDKGVVFSEFKDNDLVKYLLTGGYINENYFDFISLFHEQNLSRKEFRYKHAIKSNKEPQFEFKVESKYALVSDLDARFFSKVSILNYDIIEFVVERRDNFTDRLSMLYSSMTNRDTIYFDFIIGFITEKPRAREVFVANLIKHRKSLWDEVINNSNLPDDKIREISAHLFNYSEIEDLLNLENVETLRAYLVNLETPIAYGASLDHKNCLKEFMSNQSLKYKNIEEGVNSSLTFFGFVINNNHYEITYKNVITILKSKVSGFKLNDARKAIYTYITESELPALKDYIEQNINEFVSKVLLHNHENHSESENSLITLLNNENLKPQFKIDLIGIQKQKLISLEALNSNEAKEIVMTANKVMPTWDNVFHYYNQIDKPFLNKTLLYHLNIKENYSALAKSNVHDISNVDEKEITSFNNDILYCEDLSIDSYKELLNSLTPKWPIDYKMINSEMAAIILGKWRLDLNSHNFIGLKGLKGALHIQLVEKNIVSFIKNEVDISPDTNDWLLLLNSNNIDLIEKRKLLSQLSISELNNSKLAKQVIEVHPDRKIKTFSFKEVKILLSHNHSIESRILVLLNYLGELNDDQLKTVVSQFGEDFANLFGLYKKPNFEKNEPTHNLLKELKNREIISSITVKETMLQANCRRK